MQIVNIKTQPQHIPEVAGWLYHEWGYLHPASTSETEIRDLQQGGDDQIPLTFIAVEDGQVMGTISILPHDMETRPELTPWIASLFVPSAFRKRGIGTQLFQFAEQQCCTLGVTTAYLFTADKQAMYARLGWQIKEQVEFHGEHVTIMQKTFNIQVLNIKKHPELIPEVAGWLFHEWGHLTPDASLERSIQRLRDRCVNDAIPLTFIAIGDGQPVGTISLVPDDLKTRLDLTPWIASVFVPPAARNRGIGSQLMEFAEQQGRELGYAKLYLFTPNKQRMYARLGWQRLEDVEYRGELVTIMEKSLT